jgi:pyruvate,water dikinase
MRRALLRVGDFITNRGCIATGEDIFFLTREEVQQATQVAASTIDLRSRVAERRRTWHRQRRLVAPTTLGRSWLMHALGAMAERLRDQAVSPQGAQRVLLSGLPASPGRVTAAVRVICAPEAFGELQPDEVLVAPATTPAWSILFGRAAAVVTDTGSALAHTSLVAREFGIPAVVATGCATTRLRTGQLVTVDGSGGRVLEP